MWYFILIIFLFVACLLVFYFARMATLLKKTNEEYVGVNQTLVDRNEELHIRAENLVIENDQLTSDLAAAHKSIEMVLKDPLGTESKHKPPTKP